MEPISKHPKDFFNTGRIRVELEDPMGNPVNAEIGTNKRILYAKMAEEFPEAQKAYDEALAKQKENQEKHKAELEKLQNAAAMPGHQQQKPPGAGGAEGGEKKEKKKKKNKK